MKKTLMAFLALLCLAAAIAAFLFVRVQHSVKAEVWASVLLILGFVCWQWLRALKKNGK